MTLVDQLQRLLDLRDSITTKRGVQAVIDRKMDQILNELLS